MEFVPRILFSFFIFISLFSGLNGRHINYGGQHQRKQRTGKMFVFGDSYVDTGNIVFPFSTAQQFPYGITFPGKPTGRFSDGRVLTDFAARAVGVKSPIPFDLRGTIGMKKLKGKGINFAFGGTGVFDTSVPFPNMTTQIDFFQNLIAFNPSVFTNRDARFSHALVSVSGNDYSFYLATNGSAQGLKPFIISVVNQMSIDLKRLSKLGVRKIAITGLGPLGCLPLFTASFSFKQCNQTINSFAQFHNILLNQAVAKLNKQTGSSFVVLDVYDSFLSIIQAKPNSTPFKTPLKPCCFGVGTEFSCGSVDDNGINKFVLCQDPNSAFFWDSVHPTQHGWARAFSSLKSSF